jgi:HlyD family secretion protein
MAVVLAGVAFGLARARGPKVRTVVAVRNRIEQHLVASGRVWVPTRVQVAAQIPGRVVAVAVKEGQRVKRGDLLVQLDDAEARAAAVQADVAVDQAGARADQLRRVGAVVANEDLRQAETNLEHARTELDRTARLAASGVVPPVDLENARRPVALARAQQTAAAAKQVSAAPKGADSRVLRTSLAQAQAQLVASNVRLAQTRILALQDALVLERKVEPGDVVQPSRSLLVLAAGDAAMQVTFDADERNIAMVHVGQKARVSADAYPKQIFDADVNYVAPSIDPARGSVEIRLALVAAPTFLKPDMTVSVDLTVAAKADVVTLPSDAVHGAASASPWILAVENHRIVRNDVTLGIRGEGSVEILSRLREGLEVTLPDARVLQVGQRVRAEREER